MRAFLLDTHLPPLIQTVSNSFLWAGHIIGLGKEQLAVTTTMNMFEILCNEIVRGVCKIELEAICDTPYKCNMHLSRTLHQFSCAFTQLMHSTHLPYVRLLIELYYSYVCACKSNDCQRRFVLLQLPKFLINNRIFLGSIDSFQGSIRQITQYAPFSWNHLPTFVFLQ